MPKSKLQPQVDVVFIDSSGVRTLKKEELAIDIVGEKAFGLSCLPPTWTLPFIVVSKELFFAYALADILERQDIPILWTKHIHKALRIVDPYVQEGHDLIIRSSACTEGIKDRGKYHSCPTTYSELAGQLGCCLEKLSSDKDIDTKEIPIIIQKYISISSANGHLSNERRCYKDTRDWLCEYLIGNSQKNFQINIRNWRNKFDVKFKLGIALNCLLEASLQEVLKYVAVWMYDQKLRVHFEWVWDGKTIYLVQCDQEINVSRYNPKIIFNYYSEPQVDFKARVLEEIDYTRHSVFNKIKNVYTYQELGFPIAKLYILNNQKIINDLANGEIAPGLKDDIDFLTKHSLVIRTDIATDDLEKKQMLPRTQEERNADDALRWLVENSKAILGNKNITEDVAFIFHNFIPAVSSAFAYAEPKMRKVMIESLWGIPEGLYYYSHDKHIVDTKASNVAQIKSDKISINSHLNYKRFVVAPDKQGQWRLQEVGQPHDWKNSIASEEWIKNIAIMSRKIAEKENKSLSIMWFVDVPTTICSANIFPWHHEEFKIAKKQSRNLHKKTPLEQSFTIKTSSDIDVCEINNTARIREIRLLPSDESLLRNKDTLKKIGEIAKKINATILLEGGVLSHAYYQLCQTGAAVEVIHPFDKSEDDIEYNKLVRDKIPYNIENAGEQVKIHKLEGEPLLQALKLKLIEEAYEVLDSDNQDSIIEELADVSEVIDGILKQLNVDKAELQKIQKNKANKAGAFNEGVVLIETKNPISHDMGLFEGILDDDSAKIGISEVISEPRIEQNISKHSDKRRQAGIEEQFAEFTIPSTLKTWKCDHSIYFANKNGTDNPIVMQIDGGRVGNKLKMKVSVYKKFDPSLFD